MLRGVGHSLVAIALAAGVLLALLLLAATREFTIPSRVPATGTLAALKASFSVGGDIYDLAYDSQRDSVWYAIFGDVDKVFQMRLKDHQTLSWDLPSTDYDGGTSKVGVAGDGSVWITEPYQLIRLLPEKNTEQTLKFAPQDPGALPNALDPGNPVPGTWISAIAFQGSDAVVARNNVPFLMRVTAEMNVAGTIALPPGYDGPYGVAVAQDGTIYATRDWANSPSAVMVISPGGSNSPSTAIAGRLDQTFGGVLASGGLGLGDWLAAPGTVTPVVAIGASSPMNITVADPRGGVTAYDSTHGVIERIVDGQIVSKFVVPTRTAIVRYPGSAGKTETVAASVRDLVTDTNGNTWYFDASRRVLEEIAL